MNLEEHTQEAFEAARQNNKDAKRAADLVADNEKHKVVSRVAIDVKGGLHVVDIHIAREWEMVIQKLGDLLGISNLARARQTVERTDKKLQKLMGAGQKEAQELNKEYDRLKQKAADVFNALIDLDHDKSNSKGQKFSQKYNILRQEAADVFKDLADFEHDELGMRNEKGEEQERKVA